MIARALPAAPIRSGRPLRAWQAGRAAFAARPLLLGGVALALLLGAAYSFSVGLRATNGAAITGDEPFYLLTTQSLLDDGDLDLRQQYERRSFTEFFDHPDGLWRQSVPRDGGTLLSPHDLGLSVYVVPGFALGGLRGVQWQLLVTAAATFAVAYALCAQVCGRPLLAWLVTAAIGLSATAFVYSTEIYPEVPGALLLAGALLILARAPRPYRIRPMIWAALLLVLLVWFGAKYAPLAALVGLGVLWGASPATRAWFAGLAGAAAAVYLGFNWQVFGEPTPYTVNVVYAGGDATEIVGEHLAFEGRSYRIWGLLIDRRFGLGHWAPFLLLVVPALPFLVQRRLLPLLILGAIGVQVLLATYVALTMMGWWFPGRTMTTVLPLLAVPIALLLGAARRELRWLAVAAAVLSLMTTGALAHAVREDGIRLAVAPWEMGVEFWRTLYGAFPQYTSWVLETHLLNAAWLTAAVLALGAGGWAARRRARPPAATAARPRGATDQRRVTAPRALP